MGSGNQAYKTATHSSMNNVQECEMLVVELRNRFH